MKKNTKRLLALITGVGTLSYLGVKASYTDLSDKLKTATTINEQTETKKQYDEWSMLKFKKSSPEYGIPLGEAEKILQPHYPNIQITGVGYSISMSVVDPVFGSDRTEKFTGGGTNPVYKSITDYLKGVEGLNPKEVDIKINQLSVVIDSDFSLEQLIGIISNPSFTITGPRDTNEEKEVSYYLANGKEFFKNAKYNQALSEFGKAKEHILENKDLEIQTYILMARTYEKLNDPENVRIMYTQSLTPHATNPFTKGLQEVALEQLDGLKK